MSRLRVIGAAAAWLLACGTLVDDYAVEPEPTCGEHGLPDPVCERCTMDACADEVADCLADEACAPLHRCLVSCAADDAACRGRCVGACPIPNETASAVTQCRRARCAEACTPCGGIFDYYGGSECSACADASCCTQGIACIEDPGCSEALTCAEACGTRGGPQCVLACQGLHPTAEEFHTVIAACGDSCGTACGVGEDWECAFAYDVPLPSQETIIDRNFHFDFVTGEPIAGVTIKICNAADIDCTDPIATHVSGPDGHTAYELPGGFTGYFDMSVDGYYPHLRRFASPLLFDRDPREQVFVDLEILPAFETLAGVELEQGKGHIIFAVEDCARALAPGVTVTVEPSGGATVFYLDGSIPSQDATSTTDVGLGAIVNLLPGAARVSGTVEDTGEKVFEHVVLTRSDTITSFNLVPSPR